MQNILNEIKQFRDGKCVELFEWDTMFLTIDRTKLQEITIVFDSMDFENNKMLQIWFSGGKLVECVPDSMYVFKMYQILDKKI